MQIQNPLNYTPPKSEKYFVIFEVNFLPSSWTTWGEIIAKWN